MTDLRGNHGQPLTNPMTNLKASRGAVPTILAHLTTPLLIATFSLLAFFSLFSLLKMVRLVRLVRSNKGAGFMLTNRRFKVGQRRVSFHFSPFCEVIS